MGILKQSNILDLGRNIHPGRLIEIWEFVHILGRNAEEWFESAEVLGDAPG
jgi:hypothetical protein